MIYISDTRKLQLNSDVSCAVALGKFDGLHEGHMLLVNHLKRLEKEGYTSLLFTFSYKENSVFNVDEMKFIYTESEKKQIAENLNIDIMYEYPFDDRFAAMKPETFVKDILVDMLHAKYIVVGEDYRFGAGRSGDISLLEKLSGKYGYKLIAVPKKCSSNGHVISSTSIRNLINKGNMKESAMLLGRPYSITGNVIKGKQLGRTIGIPTANVMPDSKKIYPPAGVYATRIRIVDADIDKGYDPYRYYRGITNIGDNPTVNDDGNITIETNIFDFDMDIYGKTICIEFLEFIRPEMKFSGIDELAGQMKKDIDYARKL